MSTVSGWAECLLLVGLLCSYCLAEQSVWLSRVSDWAECLAGQSVLLSRVSDWAQCLTEHSVWLWLSPVSGSV
jgi:hypothetical protein